MRLPGPPGKVRSDRAWRGRDVARRPLTWCWCRSIRRPETCGSGGVERDDPLPPYAWYRFAPSRERFRYPLSRLPAVREPWPRAVYDRGC
ncbi:hypothetical protein GCM10017557_16640 [Streptomyces aurantiacus]|uniref:Uncharacterized protein n=1 Tax=Streptomyces aurantiacus TaxID=47760 RepID=A0A7G1P167_9ACTN|nr:hypothetical protein GCM10017557_16640 [Streptomyces aurantiacus]